MGLLGIVVGAALLVVASSASAKTCRPDYVVRDPSVSAADRDIRDRGWMCRPDMIDFFWRGHGFDKNDWNKGRGYGAPCDVTFPLARTFNGLYVLNYGLAPNHAKRTSDFSGPMVRWGANYVLHKIDELDGKCEGAGGGLNARSYSGAFVDDRVELYSPFFFSQTSSLRAAILFHEARHAAGYSHTAPGSCSARVKGTCDKWFDGKSPMSYHVRWLAGYAKRATRVAKDVRDRAYDEAQSRCAENFVRRAQGVCSRFVDANSK